MALLKCLEPLTDIGCALFGVPPVASALAVGGVKIGTLFAEHGAKHGFDSATLIATMQASVFRAADHYERKQEWRDALTEADAVLRLHLAQCVPTRDELVKCAAQEDFAGSLVTLVLDRLCDHDERFSVLAPPDNFCRRRFASDIIRATLDAALADEKYVQSLNLHFHKATVRELADLKDRQAEDRQRDIAFQAFVLAKLKADENVKAHDANDEELRGHIIALLKLNEGKSAAELVEDLKDYVAGFEALQAKVDLIEASDNRLAHAKAAAQEALERRDLDAARFHLNEAAQIETDRASDHVRGAAQSYAARADADLLALDWQAADAAWEKAAAMLMAFDVAQSEAIVWEAGARLNVFGGTFAQTPALVASERRWRALEAAARERGDREGVATMQYRLGNVLWRRGERTGGDAGLALLEEAAAAFRAALSVRTKEAMPAEWAMTQHGLGNVQQVQGGRMAGKAGLALLAKAVAAYHEALSVRTKEAMPEDWAMTQNGLGNVLSIQGKQTAGTAGLALLAKAVAAYRAALSVRTQAAMPAQWAMTQNNLGIVLRVQGERTEGEAGLALLAEAVAAYRAGLSVYTQAAMPADWAMTQNNLGIVLRVQGERTEGDAGLALLTEAVAAYRAALTIYTPEHFSHYHAMASNNLALAEAALAARRG